MNTGTLRLAAVLGAIVCAGIGFAIGKFTSAPADDGPRIVEIPAPVVNAGIPDQTAKIELLAAKLAAAERRIEELSATQEVASEPAKVAESQPAPGPAVAEERRGPRESLDERLARLKEENPEEYAAEMKRHEEREKRRQEFMEERKRVETRRDDFFANVNIAYMTPEEQKELETFVGQYKELRAMFEPGSAATDQDRGRAAMLGMGLMQHAEGVRESLLKATAKEMGFNDGESSEFAKSINEIFGATSMMGPGGGMPGPGGRGGFGPGRQR